MVIESGLLSSEEFQEFAEQVVLFCHIESGLERQRYPDLLREKGGVGHPHVAFLSEKGEVVATPEERSVPGFQAALDSIGKPAPAPGEAETGVVPDSSAFREVDYANLDRSIGKEPDYAAEPLYALFLFGDDGGHRMWTVLDKSNADLGYYDVLYCDVDFDGDLTDEGERFQSAWSDARSRAGLGIDLRVPAIEPPGTGRKHTGFRLATVSKRNNVKQLSDGSVWFQLKWDGKEKISGGYAPARGHTTVWAPSPREAPVLRPTPHAPFRFALYTWGDNGVTLPIAGEKKLHVMLGSAGSGPDTLAVVDEDFLDLERDVLTITLVATDDEGNEVQSRTRVNHHC